MRNKALVQFMELRSIIALCKVNPVIHFLKDFIATGRKIVVFRSSHLIVDSIKSAFPDSVMVTGRQDFIQKQASVDVFQNRPEIQIIICSIKAAGVGITLTASSTVLFVEQPWTYADLVQCEDLVPRYRTEKQCYGIQRTRSGKYRPSYIQPHTEKKKHCQSDNRVL